MKRVHISAFVVMMCLGGRLMAQTHPVNFYEVQKEMEALYADPATHHGSYKQWKRAEHYLENRLGPSGEIVNTEKRKWDTWKRYLAPALHNNARAYSGNWDFFGPYLVEGNPGIGRVNRIAFHPTDPDKIYVATAGGGLQYTPNHGQFWYPLTESLPVNNVSGVAIDPTEPDIIYILTGDGDGKGGSAAVSYGLQKPSIGVLKSMDGGATWKSTGLTFDESELVWPYDLIINPEYPEILFAATYNGVYLTLNGGDDWDQILNGKFFEIHFKMDEPATVFAVSDKSVFRSTTLGFTWDTIPIPLIDSSYGRMTLTTCMSDPEVLYLTASPEGDSLTNYRGLFMSTDGGQSFEMVSDTPNVVEDQSSYDLTMACNPANTNELLVGAKFIWKSTDSGAGILKIGGTHADIHSFEINPLNQRLYVGTDGGLYYSDDFGDNWTFMSEFCAITEYYKLSVSQQNYETVIGGAQDNGTHRNNGGVTTVMDQISSKDGMDCAIHPLNDSLMITGAQTGQFWISTNQGEDMDSLIQPSSLPATVKSIWTTPLAWDPNDVSNIYIGYDPVYRSFDGGQTFDPIPDTISGRRIMHVAAANSNRLYAGDRYKITADNTDFHLWTSDDQGSTWISIYDSPGFPDPEFISGLYTSPDDDEEVWISVGGFVDGEKVYRSLNAGASWANMSGSLPNTPVNTIILEGAGEGTGSGVYIGTDIGIFYTNATLGDWIPFSNGLPVIEITDLEINQAQGKILASTYGRGIWVADLFSSCEEDISISPVLQHDGKSYFFQAANSIDSHIHVDPSFGTMIIYRAGNAVLLEEGFRARSDNKAVFRALLGPCDEGGIPFPILDPTSIPHKQ